VSVSVRALWYIESHLGGDLSLDAVASASGVSRFHLSRAFSLTLAQTIGGYARARRLSEAAKALACGAPSIQELAFAAGYGSHEAFTRAFVEQFGTTPEAVRAAAGTRHLALQEPIRMSTPNATPLEAPRIVAGEALRLVGIAERHQATNAGIPAQWGRFATQIGKIRGQLGSDTFGVMYDHDETGAYTYLTAVAVKEFPPRSEGLAQLALPARTYAVWPHREHVSSVAATCQRIFEHGLSAAGLEPERAPMFERYGVEFDPRTGNGGFEIWVPVKK
jgi:AraC family transcriptional regulator